MSDSSDEEAIIRIRKTKKRQRLMSEDNREDSDEDEITKPNNSTPNKVVVTHEPITIVTPSPPLAESPTLNGNTNGIKRSSTTRTVITLDDDDDDDDDGGEREETIDDDVEILEDNNYEDEDLEDSDLDDADREDDAIIDELYDDEDDEESPGIAQNAKSTETKKKVRGLRDNVVEFLQTASQIDLESIPGVSKKKAEQLMALRPVKSWEELNRKIQSHKSAGINEDIVINAVKTIKSRTVVEKLMTDCQKLAHDIAHLVDRLPEAVQPRCIPSEMKLAPYQLIGLNWLVLMHNKGVNGILADEMGLGKTIQVIAFLAYLRESLNMHRHHLIIVPASTLDNWEREFDTWCPDIRIVQYYGNQMHRAQVRAYCVRYPNDIDVILTTYDVASKPEDRKLFKKIKLEYIIFDEAHMLKNMKSSRYQNLIKIKARRRILLTGTPVQNNLVELMSLLVFTMPRMMMSKMTHVEALFSSASREEGGRTQFEKERIEQAKKIMKPFVLRRLKANVLRDLPKKSEEVVRCPMSKSQSQLYRKFVESFKKEIKDHKRAILDDDNSFADDSNDDIKKGAGMLMAMRKLANHPLLMLNLYTKDTLKKMSFLMLKEPTHREANQEFIYQDMCVMHDFELHRLCKQYKSIEKFKLSDDSIVDSGKFEYLDKILSDLKKRQQRCLLFSQFTMMLDIMEEYLAIRSYEFLRLDGTTKVSERLSLIDEFNSNNKILVFLLSTKAGGLGINLTAANVVVIHDIDFNPYNDKQAEDRSHRMGQTKDVKVYKLISDGTVEEGMINIAEEKLKLGSNMSENGRDNALPGTKDMRSLLRSTLKL